MEERWKTIKGGAFGAVQADLPKAQPPISAAVELPEVLYQEAPGAYIRRALEQISESLHQLEKLQRTLIDEALQERSVTHQEIKNVTGVGLTTLQRWRAKPLQVEGKWHMYEEGPEFDEGVID
ncbi:hypothetical protein [Leucobacter ruminantium]|uniref:Uncharacterized protein n=1 Tax=Leucobacter ruminantium TaxID=1289170 RepID=A0A939LWT8_9MICO|nr:hypothetical protein [Leucobacter ruminantium]MBO1805886.1 hypothetical protein [Leucobacter ruminantium]